MLQCAKNLIAFPSHSSAAIAGRFGASVGRGKSVKAAIFAMVELDDDFSGCRRLRVGRLLFSVIILAAGRTRTSNQIFKESGSSPTSPPRRTYTSLASVSAETTFYWACHFRFSLARKFPFLEIENPIAETQGAEDEMLPSPFGGILAAGRRGPTPSPDALPQAMIVR